MKKTKRLVMLALALVLTFAMATTTTFAWFTMNETVTVNGISGTATANEGLLISDNDNAYRAYVDLSEGDTLNLTPVTPGTAFEDRTATPPELEEKIDNIEFYKDGGAEGTAGTDYYKQTFYFRSDVEMTVKMTKITVTPTPATGANIRNITAPKDIAANTYGKHIAYDEGDVIDTELLKAIRIALFNKEGELIAVYHLIDAVGAEGEQNFDSASGGYNMAGYLYKEILGKEPVSGGIDGTIDLELNRTSGISASITGDPDITLVYKAGTDGAPNWYKGEMTVVIWIEGTDGDCLNSVINDALEIDLEFTGTEVKD